jgi:hypothetical protein
VSIFLTHRTTLQEIKSKPIGGLNFPCDVGTILKACGICQQSKGRT